MSGWTFSLCHLWSWFVHCRLPRTSIACRRCSGLVSKVSIRYVSILVHHIIETVARCTAPPDSLDVESSRCSHTHTDALLKQYGLRMLWNDYGIVGEVIVSILLFV